MIIVSINNDESFNINFKNYSIVTPEEVIESDKALQKLAKMIGLNHAKSTQYYTTREIAFNLFEGLFFSCN